MRKIFLWGIPFLGLLVVACTTETRKSPAGESLSIPITTLTERNVTLNRMYVADIQAIQNVELRSRVSGFLDKIHVDEGLFVKKGQLLFTLSDQELRAELDRARASLNSIVADSKTVELELERVQLLVKKNILSATELEVAKAKLAAQKARIDEAEAALTHARTKLAYAKIYAPCDGIIDRIPLKVGSLLEEGTLLTTVSDISSVFVYFNISENEYLDYLRNKHTRDTAEQKIVRLVLSDGKEYESVGRIETVVSEFQENTGSIAFRARFPNPDFLLKHGASGKIKLSRSVEKALLLPQKAAFELQDRNYVFVVDQTNKVHMRHFTPRARLNDFYIVESGLKPGERIVYEGILNIRDGMRIAPKPVHPDSLLRKDLL